MPTLYNTTNLTNSENLRDVIEFLRVDVGLLFPEMIVVLLFIVAFIAIKNIYEMPHALTASSFIAFVSSLLLYAMNLLDVSWVYGTSLLMIVTLSILLYFYRDI